MTVFKTISMGAVGVIVWLSPAIAETVPGFVSNDAVIDVATQTRGVIAEHFVAPGDAVEVGAPIMALDATVLDARIAHAEALANADGALDRARAQLAAADERAQAMRRLTDRGAARQEELRTAELDLQIASADLKAVQERQLAARLDLARLQVERKQLTVKAPVSGLVTDLHVQVGELVDASGRVATLVAGVPPRIEAFVHADRGRQFSTDTYIPIALPDGSREPARVIFISARVDGASQWQEIHLSFEDNTIHLAPGRRVDLHLDGAQSASAAPRRLAAGEEPDLPDTE